MGVKFGWTTSDHLVMQCSIEYPWTWEEYQTMLEDVTRELRQETHPVATIVDLRQMKTLPEHGNVLQNLFRVDELLPDNVFGSVVVGAPHVAIAFLNILIQMRRKSRRIAMFANTTEDAHKLIVARYQTLYAQPEKQ